MAQWLGQFSGNTHKTAVLDAQELMQHAVAAFVNATAADKPKKAKSVRALAKRLHAARVRFLKTRLSAAADPPRHDGLPDADRELEGLEQALSALIAGGVAEILREFGFDQPQEGQ